jgi:hypothetical protein
MNQEQKFHGKIAKQEKKTRKFVMGWKKFRDGQLLRLVSCN